MKQAEDDPETAQAQVRPPRWRSSCGYTRTTSTQKTEVIVEHFRNNVRHHMEGRAKAMVVTSGRLHAVRYMQSFQRYIADHRYDDVRPLVAFSGSVRDPETGEDFTEPGMNIDVVTGRSISEAALPGRFASPDYQILLVAEKYQTGFDQPLLQAMYVDKRLDGVQAVQTLSRLNRTSPGKAPPFVLDFVNEPEDIRRAFEPYYDRTELLAKSDPHRLEEFQVPTGPDAGLPLVRRSRPFRGSSTCQVSAAGKGPCAAGSRRSSPLGTASQSSTTRTRRSFATACKRS